LKADVLFHQFKGLFRVARARMGALRPGTAAYDRQMRMEVKHYRKVFGKGDDAKLMEPAPAVWDEVLARTSERIAAITGRDNDGHMLALLNERPGVRMLSLGCGAGGVELYYARESPGAEVLGLDVNPEIVALGNQRAAAEGLNVRFATADLNTGDLPAEGGFDLVFCHASLHHLIALERLMEQVRRAMRPGGRLVAIDVMARNGYLLWPDTKRVANEMFKTLPAEFRLNHTGYRDARLDSAIWAPDTRAEGMECMRSADIVPLLRRNFREEVFVGSHAFSRRFFDTMYGPNYDLRRPLDRAVFEWIWQMDCHYLDTGALEPETFFGIYSA
jgi:SAM-dependent methyltransferase